MDKTKSLTLTEDKAPLEPQDRLLKSKVKTETIRFQSETEHVESLTRLERVIEDLKRQLQKARQKRKADEATEDDDTKPSTCQQKCAKLEKEKENIHKASLAVLHVFKQVFNKFMREEFAEYGLKFDTVLSSQLYSSMQTAQLYSSMQTATGSSFQGFSNNIEMFDVPVKETKYGPSFSQVDRHLSKENKQFLNQVLVKRNREELIIEMATQDTESTRELKFKEEAERGLATVSGKENQSLEELHGRSIQDTNEQQTASTQEGKGISKQIKEAIDRETVTAKEQLIVPGRSLQQTSEVSGNKEHQSHSLEIESLEIAKKEIELLQKQLRITKEKEESHSWVVYKEEVELTEEVLGRGGYQIILSVYNQELFTREMTIAAKIRHPNLLLFIGATREGEAIILTELMPTSLQKELERSDMQQKETISIAQDVACALRYLHQWRPSPIIHRDISSANVLLEPLRNGWRAKVSDYGSANFMNAIKTVAPGNPAYAAPEARYPDQHSPKMDTFSYGVLLIEMCVRELPGSSPAQREAQILQIQWAAMASLVRRCTSERQADRPSMRDIMELLASNKYVTPTPPTFSTSDSIPEPPRSPESPTEAESPNDFTTTKTPEHRYPQRVRQPPSQYLPSSYTTKSIKKEEKCDE